MRIRLALSMALSAVPTAAFAHPGGSVQFSFADGFLHPLTGADHIAAALLIGALAALSGSARAVTAAFSGAVGAGLLLGHALPHTAAAAELGILLTFAALAAAFLLRKNCAWLLPLAAAVAGLAHGLVHGSEGGGATAFAAGALAATAALASAGYLVARLSAGWARTGGPTPG